MAGVGCESGPLRHRNGETMDGVGKRGQAVGGKSSTEDADVAANFEKTVRNLLNSPPKDRGKKGPRRLDDVTPGTADDTAGD